MEEVADRFRDAAVREELGVLPAAPDGSSDPGVWTPEASIIGDQLVSPSEQAALVVLKLRQEFAATKNIEVMRKVESLLEEIRGDLPQGLQVGVSGSAAVGGDMLIAAAESLRSTETVTVLLVLAILLLVYRAPLLTAIPLITDRRLRRRGAGRRLADGFVGAGSRLRVVELSHFHYDSRLRRRLALRRRHGLLLLFDRPLSRRAASGRRRRAGAGEYTRPRRRRADGQRHDDDSGLGDDVLRRLRQVSQQRTRDRPLPSD